MGKKGDSKGGWDRPIARIPLLATLLLASVVVLLVASTSSTSSQQELPSRQETPSPDEAPSSAEPFTFNHEVMVEEGIQCLYCHADARRSPSAGMPSMQKCMGCHKVMATDNPDVQTLTDYWNRQEPIPWERHIRLPRFVYFSHQVHVVAAGLNCERCHGDVGQMSEALPVAEINMGWCLDCHQKQPDNQELVDCVVCHQ